MTKAIRKYNNLTQRIITGVLGAAAIITGLCLSEWAFFAIFFIICFFTLREFYQVIAADGVTAETIPGMFIGAFIFVVSFLIARGESNPALYLLVFPLISLVFVLKLYKKGERRPFTNIAFTILGLLYIAVPLSLVNFIAYEEGRYNFEIVLGMLLMLWATDTGAYFAGTYLGKTKLFPRVSPKKTWEGFAGGAILSLVFAFGLSRYFFSIDVIDWFAICTLLIIFGTFGDLVESLLKRSIEIKDSGSVLPGHGGFLDRFDSLLIAVPFIVAYLELH